MSPAATFTSRTTPPASAAITCSIFMDSMIISACPARTVSPAVTDTLTSVPCSGARSGFVPSGPSASSSSSALSAASLPSASTASGSLVST